MPRIARGEILGLKWSDFDFEAGKVQILRSLQRLKRRGESTSRLELVATKTEESDRSMWLPQIIIEKVLTHQRRQEEERKLGGSVWVDTGMVFTTRRGTMLDGGTCWTTFTEFGMAPNCPEFDFTIYGTRQPLS
jgi:integrase